MEKNTELVSEESEMEVCIHVFFFFPIIFIQNAIGYHFNICKSWVVQNDERMQASIKFKVV